MEGAALRFMLMAFAGLNWRRERGPMFTQIGLPQFLIIVVILVIGIVYTQRHRF
jgi:hypothetical protein